MSLTWTTAATWLIHSAVGGGLLLLLTFVLMRQIRQPVRRQRLGEWGLAAALVAALLSLGPSWLVVDWPFAAHETSAAPENEAPLTRIAALPLPVEPGVGEQEVEAADLAFAAAPADAAQTPTASVPQERSSSWADLRSEVILPWLVALYAVIATYVLGCWLLGHVALARMLRQARAAPADVVQVFASMAAPVRMPRLLVSPRLRVPVSCGLLRPTILLPAAMCGAPDEKKLRWVFAHELTHLRRRDAWSALLFGVGQALYFFVPWFWWLRRQVRLCQEYVADAAAADGTEPAADYAEFLLSLTGTPRAPRAATAVSGQSSDLLRRVSMLLTEPVRVEKRCPRRWSLAAAGGLLSLAVLVAGIGLRAEAAPAEVTHTPGDVPIIALADVLVPFEVIVDDIPAIVWQAKPAAGADQVRVYVLGGADRAKKESDVIILRQQGDKIIVLKRPQQGKVVELKDVIIRKIDGQGGTGIAIVRQGDTASLDQLRNALRTVLDKLDKGGKVDPDQIRRELEKALEPLRKAPHVRQLPIELKEYKIEVKRLADKDFFKPKQTDVDALRKLLEKLEKDGVPDLEKLRKELQKAIEKVREPQKPGEVEIEILPGRIQVVPLPGKKIEAGQPLHRDPLVLPGLQDPKKIEYSRKLLEDLKKQGLIPPEDLQKALDALKKVSPPNFERVRPSAQPRLGVQVDKPSATLADQLDLPKGQGLVITGVEKDSAAAKAGLRVNDILLEINKQMVANDPAQFPKMLDKLQVNAIDVTVLRKGKRETIKVQLAGGMRYNVAPAGWQGWQLVRPNVREVQVFTTLVRDGDAFTATLQEDKLKIIVKGQVTGGKANISEIRVRDGDSETAYKAVQDVPAAHRDRVNRLIDLGRQTILSDKQ